MAITLADTLHRVARQPGEVRQLTLFEDPDHRWIHEVSKGASS